MPLDPSAHSARPPLRLWPGVVIVALQFLLRFGIPVIAPELVPVAVLSGLAGGLLLVLWWLFFSRAPWVERLLAPAVMAVALVLTYRLLDVSIATGAQGVLFPVLVVPGLSLAFITWAVIGRSIQGDALRRMSMAVVILIACGAWTLVRTDGVNGNFDWDFAWRWSTTAEERLLTSASDALVAAPAAVAMGEADWSGFRGPGRDGVARGVRVSTDWETTPPVEMWRRPVGPGWSSFAVQGDLIFTQEQRGDEEVVSAYHLESGDPVWRHADEARFWEPMAGAGPRGTPTLAGGRLFALGALGRLNALDAATGTMIWSRDAASDAEAGLPGWGFAGSPLVVDDLVIVSVAGRLAAYGVDTGDLRWTAGRRGDSYSSPQLATLGGERHVLFMDGDSLTAVSPTDGSELWKHAWPGFHALQPGITSAGDVLIAISSDVGGMGTRSLSVERGAGGWQATERWTTLGLKPYFNDLVVHEGHAYGFDGRILACIDLETGERVWKGGRYGNGQLVLLPEHDLLLVVSEQGDIGLVRADPTRFTEVGRMPAIVGKTWNHPVVIRDVLLVRNDVEMAAYRLAPGTN